MFDNALLFGVAEIYVTVFNRSVEHYAADHGCSRTGASSTTGQRATATIRSWCTSATSARRSILTIRGCTYPYVAAGARKFFVPIYPEYHTELLPDSILNTESPKNFVENKPNRNALSKVYISRSYERGMKPGDVIVFYRTASGGAGWYTSVATTIGVVQEVITDIPGLRGVPGRLPEAECVHG